RFFSASRHSPSLSTTTIAVAAKRRPTVALFDGRKRGATSPSSRHLCPAISTTFLFRGFKERGNETRDHEPQRRCRGARHRAAAAAEARKWQRRGGDYGTARPVDRSGYAMARPSDDPDPQIFVWLLLRSWIRERDHCRQRYGQKLSQDRRVPCVRDRPSPARYHPDRARPRALLERRRSL